MVSAEVRQSPNRIAWRRFRANPTAMAGLVFVCICLLVGVGAYVVAPDHTRHANYQILEMAKKAPGSRVRVLLLPNPGANVRTSSWLDWLWGYPQQTLPLALQQDSKVEVADGRVQYTAYSGASESRPLQEFGYEGLPEEFEKQHVQERVFLLGTDAYGRDLLSRIMLGARVSLAVGFMAVLISLSIGVSLGLMAGFFRGWTDRLIMWLISVVWSIPTLLLALALSFVLGKGFWQLFVAIGLSMWVEVARIVRGQVISIRENPYAESARALGFNPVRIMFRHVLPNVVSPIIVVAVANFGAAVLIESGLSFLGIGVEVPIPSWGRMIYEGYTFIMFEGGQWLAIFPGASLILLVVSINLIGIGLRDAVYQG